MSHEVPVGTHRFSAEGHLLIVHFVGAVTMKDWAELRLLAEQVIAAEGRAYLVAHMELAGSLEPEMRRAVVHWLKNHRLLGAANIKAGIVTRALSVLLGNAIRLVVGIPMPVSFVEDEKKARAWIAELERKRLLPSQPSQPPGLQMD